MALCLNHSHDVFVALVSLDWKSPCLVSVDGDTKTRSLDENGCLFDMIQLQLLSSSSSSLVSSTMNFDFVEGTF